MLYVLAVIVGYEVCYGEKEADNVIMTVTDTPMMDHFRERDGAIDRLAAVHPFRGLGDPEDIARAAVFLASEDASWITGVPLPVDGQTSTPLVHYASRGTDRFQGGLRPNERAVCDTRSKMKLL